MTKSYDFHSPHQKIIFSDKTRISTVNDLREPKNALEEHNRMHGPCISESKNPRGKCILRAQKEPL